MSKPVFLFSESLFMAKPMKTSKGTFKIYDSEKVTFSKFVELHGGTFSTQRTEKGSTLMKWWNRNTGENVEAIGKDFLSAYRNLLMYFSVLNLPKHKKEFHSLLEKVA